MSEAGRVLLLTKYGRLGASSRLRTLQYVPTLQAAGLTVTVQHLMSDRDLQLRYARGRYSLTAILKAYLARIRTIATRHRFDLIWIEKEAFPWWPLWLERLLLRGRPYVLDFDDAIFHNYDQHPNFLARRLFGRRLDGLMASAAMVVCGNNYLAQRARNAGAPTVEILPTAIDLDRYPPPTGRDETPSATGEMPRIVWIGSPSTLQYLHLLQQPLAELSRRHEFILRVIGGGPVKFDGIHVEALPWSESTEVDNLAACDVGVMPLLDSPWEQGKCGYKLIQYMACGLPVVASRVGVNSDIVQAGSNGFLATTNDEWVAALDALLQDRSLRMTMGRTGRQTVERSYCIQKTGPKLTRLLQSAQQLRPGRFA
jgi:glycosyltransferase involved in cell wall biosynthesis